MSTIKFSKAPGFKVLIQSDDKTLNELYRYMTVHEEVLEFNWKLRRQEKTLKDVHYAEKGYNGLLCTQNLAKLIIDHINSGMVMLDDPELEIDGQLKMRFDIDMEGDNLPRISIIDKWIEIFKNHPKGPQRGQDQILAAEAIVRSNYGIVSLYTGFGKSEILLSIAESYLFEFSRLLETKNNCMIIVFNNKVKEELILRAAKYGITLTDKFDLNSHINIINPVGFFRSKLSKDKQYIDWIKNVDCVLADEAHHYSAKSWSDIVSIADPYFSYGFTATADINGGIEFTTRNLQFDKCTSQMLDVFKNTGYFLVNETLPVPVKILRTKIDVTTLQECNYILTNHQNYLIKMVNDFISNDKFAKYVEYIYSNYLNDGICFIPITTIDSGVILAGNLNRAGIKTVFWSADLSYVPDQEGNLHEATKDLTLEALKELALQRTFQVLITTTVGTEGIDLPNLNSIIPITGASYKQTIQPVGRSARANEVTVVFIWENNNPVLNKQMTSKYRTVKQLNVISNKNIVCPAMN